MALVRELVWSLIAAAWLGTLAVLGKELPRVKKICLKVQAPLKGFVEWLFPSHHGWCAGAWKMSQRKDFAGTEAMLESSFHRSRSAGAIKLVQVGLYQHCCYSSIALQSKCSQHEFKR